MLAANPFLLNSFLLTGIATLLIHLMVIGRSVLIPFVIALFCTFLLNAIARLLQRSGLKNSFCSYLLAFAALGFFIIFPLLLVSVTIPQIIEAAPEYQGNLEKIFNTYLQDLPGGISLDGMLDKIDLGNTIANLAGSIAGFAGDLIIVLIYIGFILAEQASLERRVISMAHCPESKERIRKILSQSGRKVQSYLGVKTVASLLVASITYIVLMAAGVDFAAFWALICFFLNYIPSLGSLLGIALPSLMTLVQFGVSTETLVVLLLVGAAQLSVSNILEPKLMGKSLDISPLAIIFVLFVVGAIWGIVGAFLSVPMLVIAALLAGEFETTRPIALLLSASEAKEEDL